MFQPQHAFFKAVALIDAANCEDPNLDADTRKIWPKELLYSNRMTDMLQRFASDADDAVNLAIRAHHIKRWKLPRTDYPTGRQGYIKWRTDLYKFHADTIAKLLMEVGYDEEFIERVKQAVGKKALKNNPNTQLLEDVANLVFIEHYILDFVLKHPDYDEEKWLNIISKTWNKMSYKAQQFALSDNITIPETLIPLIKKAIT